MKPFNHIDVKTVHEAVTLLKNYRGKAKLIAGGTDLLGVLKDKILPDYPEAVINIKTIPGLDHITEDAQGLKIGALAKLADIAKSPTVKGHYKILGEAAYAVATTLLRNMATIGGNLCQDVRCWYYRYPDDLGGRRLCYLKGNKGCKALIGENQYHSIFGASKGGCVSVNPSDIAVALLALDAKVKIAGPRDVRIIPIDNFFASLRNVLGTEELVIEIQIPRPPDNAKQSFLKFRLRKTIDFSIVSVASLITVGDGVCEDARIALGAVAPTPMRATEAEQTIKGKAIIESLAEMAGAAAVKNAKALSKNAYKIPITKTLVKRAILS